jgi:hypothetical protein
MFKINAIDNTKKRVIGLGDRYGFNFISRTQSLNHLASFIGLNEGMTAQQREGLEWHGRSSKNPSWVCRQFVVLRLMVVGRKMQTRSVTAKYCGFCIGHETLEFIYF